MNTLEELYTASQQRDQDMRALFNDWAEKAADGLHKHTYVPLPQELRYWLVDELSARLSYSDGADEELSA